MSATTAGAGNPSKDTGLISAITDPVAGRKTQYSYDALDRLTQADARAINGGFTVDYEAFCYDKLGNREKYYTAPGATCTTASPAITATYDGANQMTSATGAGPTGALTGTGFSYDGNGNQTSAKSNPGRTTTYNDRDQAVTTTPSGSAPVTATYAGTGNLERLTNGGTSFQATPLSPAPGRSTTGNTTTWTIRDPQGELIAIRQGPTNDPGAATSYYPFTDQVESVRTMVTTTGTVAASYTYSAYGITRIKTGSLEQPYQYGGGYTDTTTGLIKLGARFYDPTHGRFTQTDPTGQDSSYLYGADSPVTYNDPTGEVAVAAGALFFVPGLGQAALVTVAVVLAVVVVAVAIDAGITYAKESKRSGKERATDVPSYAAGESIKPGETREQAIDRILQKPGAKPSDRSKIRKYLDRK